MEERVSDFVSFLTVKKGFTKNSIKGCLRIRTVLKWLDDNKLELTKRSVEEYLYWIKSTKGLTNSSLNSHLFTLRMYDEYCEDRNYPHGFTEGLNTFKKIKPVITILTPDEIEKILSTTVVYGAGSRLRNDPKKTQEMVNFGVLTRLLATTGCRVDEAISLKKKYVDLAAGAVTFFATKNREYRRVFIFEPLITQMRSLIVMKNDEDYVFTNSENKQVNYTNYWYYVNKLKKQAGIEKRMNPHIFRHSMATQLLMEGVDISLVATILGHKDIQTTFYNYAHLADNSIRKAQFKHPILQKGLNTKEILDMVLESISKAGVNDDRFEVQLNTTNNSIEFKMKAKLV